MATSATYSDNVRTARGSKLATSTGVAIASSAASPQARIAMIWQGVPAIEAKRLVQALGVEQKAVAIRRSG